MTNAEFKQKLRESFQSYTVMKGRDYHTINELLYVLEHDNELKQENCNVAIRTVEGRWWSIPCLDAFVTTMLRGIWFNDANVDFDIDEYEGQKFGCVTVYETERSD